MMTVTLKLYGSERNFVSTRTTAVPGVAVAGTLIFSVLKSKVM